jgi:hypothetical protein
MHYMHYMPLHDITSDLHENYIKFTSIVTWVLHPGCKRRVITQDLRSNYDFTSVPPILDNGGYRLHIEISM